MVIKNTKKVVVVVLGAIILVVALLIAKAYYNEPDYEIYKSERMGIQFYYPKYLRADIFSKDTETKMLLSENGNRVIIHAENVPAQMSQYIEVYEKKPNQTLLEAVEQKVLPGKPEKCEVVSKSGEQLKSEWDYVFPSVKGIESVKSLEDNDSLWEGCPTDLVYYVMDRRYPDRYAEIYAGRGDVYTVFATDLERPWDETLTFIEKQ